MTIALCLLLTFIGVALHEMGHVISMRRYGVKIEEICLFGMGPKICGFKLLRIFGDTLLTLRLLPIGAFVKPAEENYLEKLTFREKMHINVAGIAANFVFGGALCLIAVVVFGNSNLKVVGVGTIVFVAGVLVWRFPIQAAYLLLVLGTAALMQILYEKLTTPLSDAKDIGQGITLIFSPITSVRGALITAGFLNILLGILNVIPTLPADGGWIMSAISERYIPTFWKKYGENVQLASVLLFAAIMLWSFAPDVHHLFWS